MCVCVCLSLCPRCIRKMAELSSTKNLVDVQCVAVTRHALTLRSYVKVTGLLSALPAWVCRLLRLFGSSSDCLE